jgi:hypothetical protein
MCVLSFIYIWGNKQMKMIKEGKYTITEDDGISFTGYTFDCAGDQAIDIDEVVRLIRKDEKRRGNVSYLSLYDAWLPRDD